MNWKKKTWKYATAFLVIMLAFNPGTVELALFIDAIGLDMLLLLFEVQIVAIIIFIFEISIKPMLTRVNTLLMKIDPNYFMPSREIIIEYPPMIYHAIPFLVSTYWILMLVQ